MSVLVARGAPLSYEVSVGFAFTFALAVFSEKRGILLTELLLTKPQRKKSNQKAKVNKHTLLALVIPPQRWFLVDYRYLASEGLYATIAYCINLVSVMVGLADILVGKANCKNKQARRRNYI